MKNCINLWYKLLIIDDCEGLQFLDQLDNLGTVFYMMTSVLGDTWNNNIVPQVNI